MKIVIPSPPVNKLDDSLFESFYDFCIKPIAIPFNIHKFHSLNLSKTLYNEANMLTLFTQHVLK